MAFAIELYFDAASEQAVRRLWDMLAQAGLSAVMRDGGYRPHVSLGIAEQVDSAQLAAGLAEIAAVAEPLPLELSNIGIFPTPEAVLYLGAVATPQLLALHARVYYLLARHADGLWDYYVPGTWVPHCTLASHLPREHIPAAVNICLDTPLPIHAQVAAAGLVRISAEHYAELAIVPWV